MPLNCALFNYIYNSLITTRPVQNKSKMDLIKSQACASFLNQEMDPWKGIVTENKSERIFVRFCRVRSSEKDKDILDGLKLRIERKQLVEDYDCDLFSRLMSLGNTINYFQK